MTSFFLFLLRAVDSGWGILCSSSVWLLLSFLISGFIREFFGSDCLKNTAVGSKKFTGIVLMTLSGLLIPVCSCGTAILGIACYYSGAYIGPTLAFMTATPMINPIALILVFGLMGREVGLFYLVTGLTVPLILGALSNLLLGKSLYREKSFIKETLNPVTNSGTGGRSLIKAEPEDKPAFWERIIRGLRSSFGDFSLMISKYTVTAVIFAGIFLSIVPGSFIQEYLAEAQTVTPLGILVVGALTYVCAVVHIPFIAAVIASGAPPGVAVTFLMAGAATNIPELITIAKTMGKRAALTYSMFVSLMAVGAGYIADAVIGREISEMPDFAVTRGAIANANMLITDFPDLLQTLCSIIILCLAFAGFMKTGSAENRKK